MIPESKNGHAKKLTTSENVTAFAIKELYMVHEIEGIPLEFTRTLNDAIKKYGLLQFKRGLRSGMEDSAKIVRKVGQGAKNANSVEGATVAKTILLGIMNLAKQIKKD